MGPTRIDLHTYCLMYYRPLMLDFQKCSGEYLESLKHLIEQFSGRKLNDDQLCSFTKTGKDQIGLIKHIDQLID